MRKASRSGKESEKKVSDSEGSSELPRSCANCCKSKQQTISIITKITIITCMADVFYGKSLRAPLQSEVGAAAAVVGTVWSIHPKAGFFEDEICSVQGRLIELTKHDRISVEPQAEYFEWHFGYGDELLGHDSRKHPTKKELKKKCCEVDCTLILDLVVMTK